MCIDARDRNESCGGHFREEYQTPEGEAQRDDEHYSYVAAWGYRGPGNTPELIKEPLEFDYVHPQPEELQVMKLTLKVWRQKNSRRRGLRPLPHGRRESGDVHAGMPRRRSTRR